MNKSINAGGVREALDAEVLALLKRVDEDARGTRCLTMAEVTLCLKALKRFAALAAREVGEGLREALEIARHALKNGSTLDDRYRAYIAVKSALAAPAPKPDSHQPQSGQHGS